MVEPESIASRRRCHHLIKITKFTHSCKQLGSHVKEVERMITWGATLTPPLSPLQLLLFLNSFEVR